MNDSIDNQSNIGALSLFGLSTLLRYLGYYGFRSMIVLFLIDGNIGFSPDKAITIYSWFIGSLVVTQILGGILGDLVVGNKSAIIAGAILQSLGMFLLCFSSINSLFAGLTLLTIGGGLYVPNLYANVGKLYLHKTRYLDAAFTFIYLCINLGAFIGPLVLIIYQRNSDWNSGFILAGMIMLLSAIPVLFTREIKSETLLQYQSQSTILQRVLIIFSAILLIGIFWSVYELISAHTYQLIATFSEISSLNLPSQIWSALNTILIIPICIVCLVLWIVLNISQSIKFMIGFLLASFSYALLFLIPETPNESHALLLILSFLIFNVSELLIGPIIYSVIAKYTNPKYLATIMSLSFAPAKIFLLFFKVFESFANDFSYLMLIGGTIIMSVISTGLLIFIVLKRNRILEST